MNRLNRLLAVVGSALLLSCGGQVTNGDPGANIGPTPTSGDPTDPGQLAPGACGGQTIPIVLKHNNEIPDLHLVVDKSGSMREPVDLFTLQLEPKWNVMSRTLGALVDAFQGRIRFGLSLYPTDATCGSGQTDVPMQMGNEQQIKQQLNGAAVDGWTPTHTTLAAANNYLATVPPGQGPRYVLLATDGLPNCGDKKETKTGPETLQEVQALAARDIRTFVIGFGGFIAGNPVLLDELAMAGGRPNTQGPHKFFPATNEQELKDALFTVAGGIVPPPCTYGLQSPPPDANRVTVTFDGQAVPRSLSNASGWNYSNSGHEITFFGEACTRLQSGNIKQVQFNYGCQGPVIK